MLEISNLSAGYGDSVVLNGVSLIIATGTVTALLGRNGMGKSTLCQAVMGLVPVRSGSVRLDDEEISGLPAHAIARRGVGYVPQGRGIFERFTVQENLDLGLTGRGSSGRPALAFEWFPALAPVRRRIAGTLSGGEQQMLALARALVAEPKLLILDEPSEGLQPSLVDELGQTLRRIVAERHLTMFLVEQNLALVRTIASIAAFLDDGVVAAGAAARDLGPDSDLIHRHLGL